MKQFKAIKKGIALVSTAALLLTGCGTGDSTSSSTDSAGSDVETVQFGAMSADMTQWITIVDQNTGIFAEHGLALETTEFAMGINAVDSMALGQIDICCTADYAGINRIGNASENTNLRYLAGYNTSSETTKLYVNPDIIKEASDLEGATVISISGTVYDYWYDKLFEYYGIDRSSVEIATVTSASEAAALAAADGDGAAYWSSPGGIGYQLEEYGWVDLLTLADIDVTLSALLNVSSEFAQEHPDAAVKFLEAWQETIDYIYDHEDEVAEWLYDATGKDKELFKEVLENNNYGLSFTQETYDDLASINAWCLENGNYDAEFDVKDYLSLDALTEAFPDQVTYIAE
ncbi:MAG: ABC transporter substrate-binding protein [Clostridiaceae bacterium]|nr:ABC transporter substrate-binding protein [Clostridiaceae bacterium]